MDHQADTNLLTGERQQIEAFVADNRRSPMSLRWIYLHLIEELARHAGHGDILREQILADSSATS
jgi:hypothetical protein